MTAVIVAVFSPERGEITMTDETDTDEDDGPKMSVGMAFTQLKGYPGQEYLLADHAWDLLQSLGRVATEEWVAARHNKPVEEVNFHEDAAWALSVALEEAQRPARDARGLVQAWPHRMIVTAADISQIIVTAIGEEPSGASMVGHGSTLDVRHEENIEIIAEALEDVDGVDVEA